MNFDDIIPFIIFLVYIAFMVLRKKPQKKSENTGEAISQKSGTKKGFGLSRLVDTIKAELEKAALEARQRQEAETQAAAGQTSSWDSYADPEDDDDEDFKDSTPEADKFFPAPIPVRTISKQPPPIAKKPPLTSRDAFNERKPILFSYDNQKNSKSGLILTPSKMREAVILSEILAKPVGLRE